MRSQCASQVFDAITATMIIILLTTFHRMLQSSMPHLYHIIKNHNIQSRIDQFYDLTMNICEEIDITRNVHASYTESSSRLPTAAPAAAAASSLSSEYGQPGRSVVVANKICHTK